MPELVIALVGPPLSGKQIFVDTVIANCGSNQISHHCSGNLVRGFLRQLGQPEDRPSCDRHVGMLVNEYGPDIISIAMTRAIRTDSKPIAIFDSMRLEADEVMVKSLPMKVFTVYLTAPLEVRYQRRLQRKRAGEEHLSLEQFLQNEKLPREAMIHEIGSRADVKIETGNDYEQNDLKRLEFCRAYLAEYCRETAGV